MLSAGTINSSDLERDKARAEDMLRETLEREMNDSVAHLAMGMLRRIQNRLNESQIELKTAIALDRNTTASAMRWRARLRS